MSDNQQTHDSYFEDASSWLLTHVTNLNYTISGPIEHFFASSTSRVLRVPTTQGFLYLKESAPLFHYEPALTQTISQLVPTYSPHVLLIDEAKRRLLMEDVGRTLREQLQKQLDLHLWTRVLPAFAQLQAATVPHTMLLKDRGCPDHSLAALPALFENLLADRETLLFDQFDGVSMEDLVRLHAFEWQVSMLCQELASYGIPETLHHDDLTAGNIAMDDQHTVFFDWAESAITHPFCSLFILLRVARFIFEFNESELASMRDAYLEAWTDYGSLPVLRRAFALAQRLAMLSRALTWHYAVTHMPEQERAEFIAAPAYWLLLFLHNGVEPPDNL